MIEVKEALASVLAQVQSTRSQHVQLEQSLELVLDEDVASDVDSPPHDKSLVDGYAIGPQDLNSGGVELEVLEEVTAGQLPTQPLGAGQATRVMTGAPIPSGTDAVVMIETTTLLDHTPDRPRVRIEPQPMRSGQNVMQQAASLRRGEVVLKRGHRLGAADIGLLAEVGRDRVQTICPPEVSILATGNELVPASQIPNPGQIRNSNGPLLGALTRSAGGLPIDLGIALDQRDHLSECIQRGLQSDILILSGGVSAGVLDLVPPVLMELGVEQVFHKIRLKPGKPLWFGVRSADDRHRLVFGLPGNPVSSMVCFQLFVQPAIRKLSGFPANTSPPETGRLQREHRQRGDRLTYWPSVIDDSCSPPLVSPLDWQGSGDLKTVTEANCFAIFPAGNYVIEPGQLIEILRI